MQSKTLLICCFFASLINAQDNITIPVCDGTEIPGRFFFTTPRTDTIGFVGSTLNITWFYPESTIRPSSKITIRYSSTANAALEKWTLVSDTISPSATTFIWIIPALNDDLYKLEIFGDDFSNPNPAGICTPNGFPILGRTNFFRIANQRSLVASEDKFGPSSGSESNKIQVLLGVMTVLLVFIFN